MLSFDIPSLLTFVFTACALIFGSLFVVKKAASRYFVVDASFEAGERYESRHRMSIGGAGGEDGSGGGEGDAVCAACGKRGTNRCSRCKRVRYCSQTCQSRHWEVDHKLKCKQARPPDKIEIVRSGEDSSSGRGSSKLSSISLVPARGTSKVLQEPKKILFPYDNFLKFFKWDKPGFPPCGLLNCGNSCFANVVLQCLTCTRPLTAYLLEGDHARQCIRKQEGWCFLCELQSHIRRASESRQPFSPINILSRIPSIGGNLSRGSQEDAHEFMRFAIDSMQSACLDEHGGEKALDSSTQETTLIQHIFGGHLQSQVVCTKCHMISSRYENMMDLTVEIHGVAESLEECLDQFTGTELLDGQNKYKCDGCNDYVKAHKRLRVHQAPNILTIALKRYQGGIFGKLNQRVTFPEELDLTPYMSTGGDGTDVYFLYAVVVHQDMLNASFFGHYICYTKDYHGRWYRIDDCKVVLVDAEEVHSQGAYMLLYSRRTPRKEPFVKSVEPGKKKYSASTDMDSSNDSNTESMNSDTRSLSSNTDSRSSHPLPRDTGHERQMDTETDMVKGKDHNMPEVSRELNSTVWQKDPQSIDLADSQLSSLGPKNSEEVSTVSLIGTTVSIGTPPSSEAQTMECEESYGIQTEDNGSTCTSGYASDSSLSTRNMGSNIIHDNVAHSSPIASCGSSSSMDLKTPNNPELKSDPLVAGHPAGSADEVQQPVIVSDKNGRPTAPISGSKEKPKALFSRGFLDRPTADKRLERGKRVETQKTVGTATMVDGRLNGHVNSVHGTSTKGPSSSDDSGFLMRPYAQSNKKISIMTMNGNTCDKDNGYNEYKIGAILKSDRGKDSNGEPVGFGEQSGSTSKFVEGQSSSSE